MIKDTTVLRLRIAHFFLGMMFFYGIEQLFLDKIIGDSSTRAFVTIVFTASLLVFDIPAGMLADKFGRKKSLLAACVAQTAGLLVMGLSSSLMFYLLGSILYGLFVSLMNGAVQAFLYDYLALRHQKKLYAKLQGSMYATLLIGVGIANVCSGFIAHRYGLRAPYLLGIIPSILAATAVYGLVEPPLQKQAVAKWYKHLHGVTLEIRSHPRIIIFGLQFIISSVLLLTIGEFGQIYILSFGVGTVALGIIWAIDAVFAAGGRYFAHRLQRFPTVTIIGFVLILSVFILTHNKLGILLFWLFYGWNQAVLNVAETEIQDETKSSMRATMFSTVSFVANACAIPLILLFNHFYITRSIHTANFILGSGAAVLLVISLVIYHRLPKTVTV